MSLRNILERKVVSCSPEATIKEVAELMESQNVGAVLVLKGGRPEGIVTDRDIVLRCVVKGNDCEKAKVSEIMTDEVQTVNTHEGIFDVITVMKHSRVRRVPVVDDAGKAVGLLSLGDIYQLLAKEMNGLLEPLEPEETKIVDQAA